MTLALPSNASAERKRILRSLGAELIFTDALEGMDQAIRTIRALVAEQSAVPAQRLRVGAGGEHELETLPNRPPGGRDVDRVHASALLRADGGQHAVKEGVPDREELELESLLRDPPPERPARHWGVRPSLGRGPQLELDVLKLGRVELPNAGRVFAVVPLAGRRARSITA